MLRFFKAFVEWQKHCIHWVYSSSSRQFNEQTLTELKYNMLRTGHMKKKQAQELLKFVLFNTL